MTEHKSFLRNFFEAMVESRAKQAAREVAYYRRSMNFGDGPSSSR